MREGQLLASAWSNPAARPRPAAKSTPTQILVGLEANRARSPARGAAAISARASAATSGRRATPPAVGVAPGSRAPLPTKETAPKVCGTSRPASSAWTAPPASQRPSSTAKAAEGAEPAAPHQSPGTAAPPGPRPSRRCAAARRRRDRRRCRQHRPAPRPRRQAERGGAQLRRHEESLRPDRWRRLDEARQRPGQQQHQQPRQPGSRAPARPRPRRERAPPPGARPGSAAGSAAPASAPRTCTSAGKRRSRPGGAAQPGSPGIPRDQGVSAVGRDSQARRRPRPDQGLRC